MAQKRFERLLEPGRIGMTWTRNRIFKTGATTSFSSNGYPNQRHLAFYEALARGGTGLIILGNCTIHYYSGSVCMAEFNFNEDKYIPSLSEFARVIGKYDCRVFPQLGHDGGALGGAYQMFVGGEPAISSSSLEEEDMQWGYGFGYDHNVKLKLRGLTIEEIEELVDRFAAAAERARKAGFDGVEIHGSSNHLINSFLSRAWNKRTDKYGPQSLENRARFMVETIQAVKKRVGQDFPVIVNITGAEFGHPLGTTSEDSVGFAKLMEAAGADAIQVKGFGYMRYTEMMFPDSIFYPEPPKPLQKSLDGSRHGAGATTPVAAAIKKVVSIPVMTGGRLDPVLGEKILREGKSDFIGMTRRLIADPELTNKVAAGRLEDITPCTACLNCCPDTPAGGIEALIKSMMPPGGPPAGMMPPGGPPGGGAMPDPGEPSQVEAIPNPPGMEAMVCKCRINAAMGGQEDYIIPTAPKKKKVLVVGGGPAGMEAARVAAIRGHDVVLVEKEPVLGGMLPLQAMVRGTEIEDVPAIVRYLKAQITKLRVDIRRGKEFSPAMLDEIQPDAVIIATGGISTDLEIPGVNRRNVISGSDLHRKVRYYLSFLGPKVLRWLTKFWMPVGKKVVVIGGDIQGCELAEFLVKRGRKVTIVEEGDYLGESMVVYRREPLLDWLEEKGTTLMTGVKYEKITKKGLVVTNRDGQIQIIEADTIIPSILINPDIGLFEGVEGKVPEVYAIGDSKEPGMIKQAISDAYHTARAI